MGFDSVTVGEAIDRIVGLARADEPSVVVTANLDHVRRFGRDARYRGVVEGSPLVVADGMPVLWAAWVSGAALPERVAGSSLLEPLCRRAGEAGLRVFLLGGEAGVAERCAGLLESRCPGLFVAGVFCPARGFESSEAGMGEVAARVGASGADIVCVALGSPKQEFVAEDLMRRVPAACWIGVGISFSFVTGDVRRAPRWMQRVGLEWTHRLVQEPRRLFRRYLVEGVPFAAWLLGCALLARVGLRRDFGRFEVGS